jgi:hypothetical protein
MSRWTEEKSHAWYKSQPWLVGPNYIPASACNQIEMWQEGSFDLAQIEKELIWAKEIGLNTARVFLHDLVWQEDPEGYKKRIDAFLTVAAKHGIKPMLVLFDSVWNPNPHIGPQEEPKKGIHNAGWVQGPGAAALQDPLQKPRLQSYVEGIVKAFSKDKRILAWDIWNEPDNMNGASYGAQEPQNKVHLVAPLLKNAFAWARNQSPDQPLTSGVWAGDWSKWDNMNAVQRVQLEESDIITFHNYGNAENFRRDAKYMSTYNRPMICTEYMARATGSTFEAILPIMKELNIGGINWGFVEGRAQTHIPWDSWQTPYTEEPKLWFHEILRTNGTPYRQSEVDFIKSILPQNKNLAQDTKKISSFSKIKSLE